MKRSTKTAPVSLSTSYLIGSARIGISMMTLKSLGTSLPAGTRSKLMAGYRPKGKRDYKGCPAMLPCRRRWPSRRRRSARAAVVDRVARVDGDDGVEACALGGPQRPEFARRAPGPDPAGPDHGARLHPRAGGDHAAALDHHALADLR